MLTLKLLRKGIDGWFSGEENVELSVGTGYLALKPLEGTQSNHVCVLRELLSDVFSGINGVVFYIYRIIRMTFITFSYHQPTKFKREAFFSHPLLDSLHF